MMITWDVAVAFFTIVGVIASLTVVPAVKYIMGLAKRLTAVEADVATVKTDQKWLMQSMSRQEEVTNKTREEVAEVNGKLDTVLQFITERR